MRPYRLRHVEEIRPGQGNRSGSVEVLFMSVVSPLIGLDRCARRPRRRPQVRPCHLRIEALEQREVPDAGLSAVLNLDLGTNRSPVAPGFVGVPVVAYSETRGYGWESTLGI